MFNKDQQSGVRYDQGGASIPTLVQSTLDQAFEREYDTLVHEIISIRKIEIPKVNCERPILDLHVKILFDEDLTTMLFPKIHEFEFRTNQNSPIELAAKILAI